MKFKFDKLNTLLRNKLVLQLTAVVSIFYVIGLLTYGRWENLLLYLFLCALFYNFTKNMIVVLGAPLLLVNLLIMMHITKEGLENANIGVAKKAIAVKKKQMSTATTTTTGDPTTEDPTTTTTEDPTTTTEEEPTTTSDDTTMVSSTSTSEAFDGKKNNKKRGSYELDYASTIENAYDDLNKILGSGGMQSLTADTKGLMEQQMKLAESMKSMEPLIKNMSPLIQQFGKMFAK